MIDLQKVKEDYEKLKKQSVSRLLPFDKVVFLEKSKQFIIQKYLSRITGISRDFEITASGDFNLEKLIHVVKTMFGDLNYYDTGADDDKLTIDMAFHFCIISLSYKEEKVKYKVTVFWDM